MIEILWEESKSEKFDYSVKKNKTIRNKLNERNVKLINIIQFNLVLILVLVIYNSVIVSGKKQKVDHWVRSSLDTIHKCDYL